MSGNKETRVGWAVWAARRLGGTVQLTSSRQPGFAYQEFLQPATTMMPLHARFSPSPSRSHLVTDSWVPYRLPSPAQSLSLPVTQSVVLVLAAAGLEDPKVLHRPDFDGFIRCSSIISSFIVPFILSFPSPTPSAHPGACRQSLHLIITPAPSLHHPSPLYTQPVNASSCHPFHLPCKTPPPKLHYKYCHDFVMLALTHTCTHTP